MYLTLRVIALTALSVAGLSAANIVVNGGFEAPDIPAGTFALLGSVPGWNLASGPSIEIQDHVAGSPFEGQQFLELDSNGASSVYQDLATTPGAYSLRFAFSPRPGVPVNTMQVLWDGLLLDTLNASGTGLADTQWAVYNYTVTATGPTTRLQFSGVGPSNSLGEYVDAVVVESVVPEPASLASALLGLIALVSYAGARRSSSK
jgi:hypothetical protein